MTIYSTNQWQANVLKFLQTSYFIPIADNNNFNTDSKFWIYKNHTVLWNSRQSKPCIQHNCGRSRWVSVEILLRFQKFYWGCIEVKDSATPLFIMELLLAKFNLMHVEMFMKGGCDFFCSSTELPIKPENSLKILDPLLCKQSYNFLTVITTEFTSALACFAP